MKYKFKIKKIGDYYIPMGRKKWSLIWKPISSWWGFNPNYETLPGSKLNDYRIVINMGSIFCKSKEIAQRYIDDAIKQKELYENLDIIPTFNDGKYLI